MELTASSDRFRAACSTARQEGSIVGFVPTMGALHQGHGRLVAAARRECGFVALSIFVNPLQFGTGEDFSSYPRRLEQDRAVATSLGCDVLFAPEDRSMYPHGRPTVTLDPGALGERLEGRSRPGHFSGVLTVVAKLLNLAGPGRAYFGEKDAQQLFLVRRMVADLDIPVEVVAVPVVREIDGLALSSRNVRLSRQEREAAPALFDALTIAAQLARAGERDANVLRAQMARRIGAEPMARLDYVAIVDEDTWDDLAIIEGPARALVAARFGSTRLIDNVLLPWEPSPPAVQNTSSDEEAR